MHQHIEWDEPGNASVMQYFKKHPDQSSQPDPGDIISARYQGAMVRVKVEAYREDDAVSIGEVAAIIDTHGGRHQSHNKLEVGHIVRVPDDKRAMEKWGDDET
ncbi:MULTISPECIES: hypothetical protein [Halomonadaceae]|jgi:hypothetical protein|uniref:hypothetical protein n=1 Tax=Halomonadaceae TaxID=28256 RepID=UPI0012EFE7BC|nr:MULTISPECIES: hypothetical protein [Halomonas]UEQ04511.1 hypothetical protein LMS44_01215 [Halomonas profundus]CAD5247879.1 conserved hypothetical protein [Halomonas sp. I3]CAD5269140.1 conserved hypothetical protein [Halomonas sp. 113]CAD5271048.1 conserved hypothetical protein [Halomonas sp. 59]CAD5282479.1 conserved hypothetical protein [Halomonas sp. 156]